MTIELYTWRTPNGRKISIMLEEVGLPYRVHPVDIGRGEQFAEDFARISPHNKIPVIVDPEGPGGRPVTLFQSGAILIYLADKAQRLLPREPRPYYAVMEWLMFQMGDVGPMFGQANHFRKFAKEKVPYGIERYTREAHRMYRVLDQRLAESEYLAGDEYTIADIATYPWVARYIWHDIALEDIPNVKRWFEHVGARTPVAAGMAVPQ